MLQSSHYSYANTHEAMNTLAIVIQAELERRNWSLRDLAAASELAVGGLSDLMNKPQREPKLHTLAAIARGFKINIAVLVEALGYPVELATTDDEDSARIGALLRSDPDLRPFLDNLFALSAEDRSAMIVFAEALVRRRRGL